MNTNRELIRLRPLLDVRAWRNGTATADRLRMDAKGAFVTPQLGSHRLGGDSDEDSGILPLFFVAVPF
jgi:hypothetical protein